MQFFTWKQLFRNSILEHGCTFDSFLDLVWRCLFLYMYDYNGRGFVIHICKEICGPHKYCTYVYREYHSVCPLVRNGTPTLSSASECAPPEPKGGGRSQFGGLEKKPSTLSTLWWTVYDSLPVPFPFSFLALSFLFFNLKHSRP